MEPLLFSPLPNPSSLHNKESPPLLKRFAPHGTRCSTRSSASNRSSCGSAAWPGSSARRPPSVPACPAHEKAAASAAASWWRRGESNSRPHRRHPDLYARIPGLGLAARHVPGRTRRVASSLFVLAPRPGSPAKVASLLITPVPARRRKRDGRRGTNYAARANSSLAFVFSRRFNEANRGPRRATRTSTSTSKPVAPWKSSTKTLSKVPANQITLTSPLPQAHLAGAGKRIATAPARPSPRA